MDVITPATPILWAELKTAFDWADATDAYEEATQDIPENQSADMSMRAQYEALAKVLSFMVASPKLTYEQWGEQPPEVVRFYGQQAFERYAQKKSDLEKAHDSFVSSVLASGVPASGNSGNGATPTRSNAGVTTTT